MTEKNELPKDFEALSRAISKAIFQSLEVKEIISQILQENGTLSNNLLIIVLKLETLKGSFRPQKQNHKETTSQPPDCNSKLPEEGLIIEGVKLKPRDIAFLNFCSETFDEEKWLKKHKIIFPKEE